MPSGSASENPVVVASEVDKRLGDLLARYLGAFSGQRQGWKTPKRTLWQCTASVCVAGVYCWEISLGLADPGNCLSCLFILGFLFMFIVYRRILCLGFILL